MTPLMHSDRKDDISRIAPFMNNASDGAIRAAYLCAIGLELSEEELNTLLGELWPGEDYEDEIDELKSWPFVISLSNTIRIDPALKQLFARNFLEIEKESFVEAHKLLVSKEEGRRDKDNLTRDEDWYVRGRLAYYLAGVDDDESIELFEDTFRNLDVSHSLRARMWLSTLAIHQEYLLNQHRRVLAFYRGFQAYMLPNREKEARQYFDEVLQSSERDLYRAIALHLNAILKRDRCDYLSIREMLLESIEISQSLALDESAVMARHTLIWRAVDERRGDPDIVDDWEQIEAWAKQNFEIAKKLDDQYHLAWGKKTLCSVEWLSATHREDEESLSEDRARELVEGLREAMIAALDYADIETSMLAANDAAQILRDIGDYDEAIKTIREVLRRTKWAGYQRALRNLAKTTGSIISVADKNTTRILARRTLADLDERQRSQ